MLFPLFVFTIFEGSLIGEFGSPGFSDLRRSIIAFLNEFISVGLGDSISGTSKTEFSAIEFCAPFT